MSQKEASATPMLRQYQEIKDQYRDCILFYRIGDFYEMFYDDAVTASKVLDIVLTSRNKNDPNPVPLCGIPHHSYQPYLEKLVEKGHKVAICDQVEDPALAKGIVKREVIRVVTPGLAEDRSLVAVARGPKNWGIASLEIGTGNFRVTEVPSERGLEELRSLNPSEVVLSESRTDEDAELQPLLITRLPDWLWDESTARKILQDQFGVATLSGFNCETLHEGVIAAGAVLHYVKETQKVGRLPHLTSLKRYERSEGMLLNEETRKNLSLTELIDLIDHTKTSLGKRTLRSWMESPLIQKGAIEERLDAVEELQRHPVVLERLQKLLGSIYDLEKIASRLSLGTANARDLRAIADSLAKMEELRPLLEELGSSKLKEIRTGWDSLPSLLEEIEKTIVEEPPLTLREGGLIKEGVQEGLDELRTLQKDAKGAIAAMEERERERTGISSLKIRYNQVFGYYLEVTAAHLSKVPLDFTRKQTLTNAERYITPELKEFEGKILGAEEKIRALEFQIFNECRERALAAVPQIQRQADRVGQLDAWASLATYARQSGAVRPRIDESRLLKIRGGRHPVVEKCLPVGSFVPNDLLIDGEGDRLLMVTGPNMAGKSTIIRQAGLLVLMAQAGSFVPAVEAVGPRKLDRLVHLAEAWLALQRQRGVAWRLAVMAVTVGTAGSETQLIDVVE